VRAADHIDAPSARPSPPTAIAAPSEAMRRCIVTGAERPKAAMVRFVVGPEDEGGAAAIVPDVDERLPGRGLWVTAARDIVASAVAKRLFAKAAKRPVATPADLLERVERLLVERCVSHLGLARRAGAAVAGFEKVRAAVQAGRAALLLAASDRGAGDRAEIAPQAGVRAPASALTAAELGRAFGRERTTQVAVMPGRLAEALTRDLTRLAGFRAGRQAASVA
jgi:predicted RNA-binding protein YlxR (DUF448 family)